jgi:hypothetical protein
MTKKAKLVLAGIGCAAALLVAAAPSLLRARSVSECNACLNYLMQIDGAKQIWEVDNHKTTNDVPTWADLVVADHNYLKKIPSCPGGGIYTIGRLDEKPRCSIPTHKLQP